MIKVGVGFHGGIGNWVLFTPVLQLISDTYGPPDIILDDSWQDENREAIELLAINSHFVDKIINFKDQYLPDTYDKLYMSYHSSSCNGLFLNLHPLEDSSVLEKFPSWADTFIHELEWYILEACEVLALPPSMYPQHVPIDSSFELDCDKYIVLSNGYLRDENNIYAKKSWNDWVKLVETLYRFYDYEYEVVLLGGKDDMEWGQSLARETGCLDYTGQLNIIATASVIANSFAVISTDTGIYHIADALNIPGVVMFGPTLVSKNGPYNNSIIPIRSNFHCSPCQGTFKFNDCEGGCMDAIKTSNIMSALRSLIML